MSQLEPLGFPCPFSRASLNLEMRCSAAPSAGAEGRQCRRRRKQGEAGEVHRRTGTCSLNHLLLWNPHPHERSLTVSSLQPWSGLPDPTIWNSHTGPQPCPHLILIGGKTQLHHGIPGQKAPSLCSRTSPSSRQAPRGQEARSVAAVHTVLEHGPDSQYTTDTSFSLLVFSLINGST